MCVTEQTFSEASIRKPILSRTRALSSFECSFGTTLFRILVSAASVSRSPSLWEFVRVSAFRELTLLASEEHDDGVDGGEHQSLEHQSSPSPLSPRRFVSSELSSSCFCSGIEKTSTYDPAPIELHPRS